MDNWECSGTDGSRENLDARININGTYYIVTQTGYVYGSNENPIGYGNVTDDMRGIVREFPQYFLDYREVLDPTIRWTDRLQSSSGDWSGNLFDFFFRVNSKLVKDVKIPFVLERL